MLTWFQKTAYCENWYFQTNALMQAVPLYVSVANKNKKKILFKNLGKKVNKPHTQTFFNNMFSFKYTWKLTEKWGFLQQVKLKKTANTVRTDLH